MNVRCIEKWSSIECPNDATYAWPKTGRFSIYQFMPMVCESCAKDHGEEAVYVGTMGRETFPSVSWSPS